MQKFSCLGTTDKDVLISESFFLDVTDWNPQAAVGACQDFESPNICVPSTSLVEDATIGEGDVEVGGLLGVTERLSYPETEFNTQPHRKVEGSVNPRASPQKNRPSDENNLKDPRGSGFHLISKNTWAPAPHQTEQDENRPTGLCESVPRQSRKRLTSGDLQRGAPRALSLRPVLNRCQQEEKLTKDRRLDFGGEGRGFLWIADHIARTPGSDP
ncbi:hypothetical protein CB1_000238017 [Camelus ferus]|nr:hypothetical protein CB1_000238017 [Camelus ferus]